MKELSIGKKKIGGKNKCFITFEAGPTHFGFDSAKRLIKFTKNAGADAIKFQYFNPQKLYAIKNLKIKYKYLKRNGKLINIKKNIYEIFKKRFLNSDQIKKLKKYADKIGLEFFLTIGDDDGVNLISELKCKSVKIASSDINYHQLIKKVAKKKIVIQLDTGNSTLHEIHQAIRIIEKQGNKKIIIHYCPTGYPAENLGINLEYIKFLKKKFKYPIGYSDHFKGHIKSNLALCFGADLIEKTISQNIFSKNIEHAMSIDVKNTKTFVRNIRDTENILNKKILFLSKNQVKKRASLRRSAYSKTKLKKGYKIKLTDIEFKRPGFGVSPDKINIILNKKLKLDIKKNTLIKKSFFK